MKFKDFINSPTVKTVGKYVGLAFTAIVAVNGALSEQKKEKGFEELKKDCEELKKKVEYLQNK